MSQFAIILIVLLVASAVHASEWSPSVSTAQSTVQQAINTAIIEIQEKQKVTNEQNRPIAQKLSDSSAKSSLKTADEIILITQKVGSETSNLASNAKGVNISECLQYPNHLNVTAKTVILSMSECFAEKLRIGLDQMVDITRLFEDQFSKLNAIKKEAKHCSDNTQDEKSANEAVLCIKEAGKKSTSSAKFVEELTAKNAELDSLSKRFDQLLTGCRNKNEFVSFHEESSTVVEKTSKCIQKKTNNAQH